MSKYPPADSATQWFQNAFPGATMNLTAATCVLCLHTTEGASWPGYMGGAEAPTYTAKPRPALKRIDWRQHFPDEKSARALENHPGGVETNTLNCVQVELVGTCDPTHKVSWPGVGKAGVDYIFWPDAPDWLLQELAKFVAYMHTQHGLALVAPTFLPYPQSINGDRFTDKQWTSFVGICGHQHVPENSHGDPGNLDVPKLIAFTKAILAPAPAVTPVKAAKVKLGHPSKLLGQTEAFGDSDRGIAYFAKKKCARVDGNALLSSDSVPVNTHYEKFLRHGFVRKDGKPVGDKNVGVSNVTANGLRQYWTQNGHYEIRPSLDRIELAFKAGMDYEFEIKCRMSKQVAVAFRAQVVALEGKYPGRRVIVKVLNNQPGKAMWLAPFHRAGFPTLITTHTPLRRTSKQARPFCDEYRGFKPRWV